MKIINALDPELIQKYPQATPIIINEMLWNLGQNKSESDKPYHRTRTIWY
jgi:hypothetical protein